MTVDLTCVNDAPVAVDDTGSVPFAAPATDFDVLANDTDVENDTPDPGLGLGQRVGRHGQRGRRQGPLHAPWLVQRPGRDQLRRQRRRQDGHAARSTSRSARTTSIRSPPPRRSTSAPAGSMRSAPLLISWSSSDIGSGVASHELQVSIAGGSFTTIYTGAGTSFTKLFPFNKTLVWRMRATDAADNDSAWATSASRKIVPYQRNSKNAHVHRHVDQGDLGRLLGHRLCVHQDPRQARPGDLHRTRGALRRAEDHRLGLREGVRRRQAHRALQPPRVLHASWAGSSRARRGAPVAPTRCA